MKHINLAKKDKHDFINNLLRLEVLCQLLLDDLKNVDGCQEEVLTDFVSELKKNQIFILENMQGPNSL